MLRHVLCVLALALCCTSVWVTASDMPNGAVELKLKNGDAKITLTETVDDSSCTAKIAAAGGKSSDVSISTTVTLKKKKADAPTETTESENGQSKIVKVPVGHSLTLVTTLNAECTKEGATVSQAPETTCTGTVEGVATNTITYDATMKPTPTVHSAVNPSLADNREVSVPVGSNVKLIAKVVATCAAVSEAHSSRHSTGTITSSERQEESLDVKGAGRILPPAESHPSKHTPIKPMTGDQQTQGGKTSQQSNNPVGGSLTGDPKPTGQGDADERSSAITNDDPAPAYSEVGGTETENTVPVKDTDYTASTVTPQSETTAEEAPKTDVGAPTSAGEGVKLPERNTDASSSSSTAWVRAPLLLLLAGVAVW
ncbi:hypothetical protein DQ04_15161000 [Trypanosoma grayi]|uniref:hypothetical protein n=1 Tax=Trypanosoma grayi TaxID=71804 RepID=UPI0004F47C3B|nr:hypothetical protein DQ04_15161000 [Trypanosoma grayi]KEG06220.1 hypothetical protein DQ04_15161000 [Trypanosoma grayi]